MTVTKRIIAKNIAKNIQINESESLAVANGFFEIIKSSLAQNIVKISGFGSFHRTITVQRITLNQKRGFYYLLNGLHKLTMSSTCNHHSITEVNAFLKNSKQESNAKQNKLYIYL